MSQHLFDLLELGTLWRRGLATCQKPSGPIWQRHLSPSELCPFPISQAEGLPIPAKSKSHSNIPPSTLPEAPEVGQIRRRWREPALGRAQEGLLPLAPSHPHTERGACLPS